jgi:LysR family glycine cleavage system transcriptional activator
MSFLETVTRALELLRAGAASVARQSGRRLRLSTLPAFAHSWLVYRIERFLRAHPDIDLEIDTTPSVVDLKSGEADLAIRHGLGNWEGLEVIRFLDDELQAVCSPNFRDAHPEIKEPRDLKEAPLLRHTAQRWAPWFRAAGLDWPEPARGPAYSDSAVMLAAAAEGHGVALAKRLLAAPAIESGRLVPLFPLAVKAREAYHIVYVKPARDRPEVNAFVEWLLSEAEPSGNGANC